MGMLSQEAVSKMGFRSLGKNVLISDKASFYGLNRISFGNDVRIDDYCVISAGEGGVAIGNYVHIACYCSLIGAGRIEISDFSLLSSRVAIYSSNDDYSGNALTNPTVPSQYTNVQHADVILGKHVAIGCGSVVLPGVFISEGVAIGALSLVKKNCGEFGIYAGQPARRVGSRSNNLKDLEHKFLATLI